MSACCSAAWAWATCASALRRAAVGGVDVLLRGRLARQRKLPARIGIGLDAGRLTSASSCAWALASRAGYSMRAVCNFNLCVVELRFGDPQVAAASSRAAA